MDNQVKTVVIVGGGTAGWLTAGVIAAEYGGEPDGIAVTLIESPQVATVGVGEGTWPTMRDTLRRIGASELDFIRQCDASFKQGSKFIRWTTGQDSDSYYHPFSMPNGFLELNRVYFWQSLQAEQKFADAMCAQPQVCEHGLAPKQLSTPEFAAVLNYGYHLDAGKFGEFLKRHCIDRLGVRHVLDHVTGVNSSDNGDIASLSTAQSGQLSGDLFVDCSGSAALLLGNHFQVPFVSKQGVLFNDCALAAQVPYGDPDAPVASTTHSTAQRAGWIWDIGLQSRRGVGHVYASAYTSDEQAEQDLRAYLEPSLGAAGADSVAVRKIHFNPGYRAEFWHKNCVAIGMAAGFIEPLEASALALVELAAAMIRDDFPANRALMDITAKRFNARFRYRADRVINFLKLHYVLSQRRDGAYWKDNIDMSTVPDSLQELLSLWRYQVPSRLDFIQAEEVFPAASYQYILYGMGFNSHLRQLHRYTEEQPHALRVMRANAISVQKYLHALPSNRALLQHICGDVQAQSASGLQARRS
ncbi:tryptophan 7-halogenase [Exilibacterium tricleocarpae]|uniref:Tryptophan 7-halogenase n=1 Tax=Exilibacterium tricleocarpae TaxID=2591008 RepID=A0A545SLW0_9GAMM|nr:tryptophan halogenase family protein [Exilibacterium tricleocarpae]TQV65964.1 tryptophan 7-halogenase [Exilibacterium tricleocarpae]